MAKYAILVKGKFWSFPLTFFSKEGVMKSLWTFLVGCLGISFFIASGYNLSKDHTEIFFWGCLFLSVLVIVRADVIVNIAYRLLGPKPMAVHVIGVPRKRFQGFQKNF